MPDIQENIIPQARVPLIDQRTGAMTREWYLFFYHLLNETNDASTPDTEALEIGPPPPPSTADVTAALNALENQLLTGPPASGIDATIAINDVASEFRTLPVPDQNLGSQQYVTAAQSRTPRTLAQRFGEVYNVKDYGALGDGGADDAPAIQLAADTLTAAGIGELFFPAGTYKIGTVVTLGDCNVSIRGEGAEVTTLESWNGTGCILHDVVSLQTGDLEYHTAVEGITFVPRVVRASGTGQSGYAIRSNRPVRPGLGHISQIQTYQNVCIRLYAGADWPDPTSPQWDYGVYLTNASETTFLDCVFDGSGGTVNTAIRLDNTLDVVPGVAESYFNFRVMNTDFFGWGIHCHQTGWVESVYVDNCLSATAFDTNWKMDASGTLFNGVPGTYLGHWVMTNTHINAQSRGVWLANWKHVHLDNMNMYLKASTGADANTQDQVLLFFDGGSGSERAHVTNSQIGGIIFDDEFPVGGSWSLVRYSSWERILFSNCTMEIYANNATSVHGDTYGFFGEATSRKHFKFGNSVISQTGVQITGAKAFFHENTGGDVNECDYSVHDNSAIGWDFGVYVNNIDEAFIEQNHFYGTGSDDVYITGASCGRILIAENKFSAAGTDYTDAGTGTKLFTRDNLTPSGSTWV